MARSAGCATSVLIAAEWPIYGRFGFGPATMACGWHVDVRAVRFERPALGQVRLVTGAALRGELDAIVDGHFAVTPGTLRREAATWDRICGVTPEGVLPDPSDDSAGKRFAIWYDERGRYHQTDLPYMVTTYDRAQTPTN